MAPPVKDDVYPAPFWGRVGSNLELGSGTPLQIIGSYPQGPTGEQIRHHLRQGISRIAHMIITDPPSAVSGLSLEDPRVSDEGIFENVGLPFEKLFFPRRI